MPLADELDIEIEHEDDDSYDDDDDDDAPDYGDMGVVEAAEEMSEDEPEELQDDAAAAVAQLLNADADDNRPIAAMNTGTGTVQLTIRDILRILATDNAASVRFGRRRRTAEDDLPPLEFPAVTEPQERGQELLFGGEFGKLAAKQERPARETYLSRVLRSRGTRSRPMSKEDVISHIVPNTNGVAVASYESSAYAGQFSADSSFYYTCCQDWQLHVYDMTVAHKPWEPRSRRNMATDHQTTMSVIKDIEAVPGRWTITDSHLSPDNQRMIYSSITPTVYMTNTLDSSPEQVALNFNDPRPGPSYEDRFAIWSCRFSADGNEVIAGGNAMIYVYDLLANRRTVKIVAHDDDVNSCCWADTASGNVLVSASDDTFLKVWDRRSLGAAQKPAGVLVGHTEGITSVSAKGDGRYVISNGKDQALRLWDLRNMRSSTEFDQFSRKTYRDDEFDYRYGTPPRLRRPAHPADCSVMTYRGHTVLQTLIRCWFSPMETTGARYIYSGSADGRIHIWSLDGRIVQVLDRSETLPMAYDPDEPEPPKLTRDTSRTVCVRDVSWHSQQPVLMSVGWANRRSGSIVARHEWKGLSKLGHRLEDWVDRESAEYAERTRPRPTNVRIPGAFVDDEDDEAWTDDE